MYTFLVPSLLNKVSRKRGRVEGNLSTVTELSLLVKNRHKNLIEGLTKRLNWDRLR